MTQLPLDAPGADEQAAARIREALDVTLFVEAGAGTGKTWALVERVVSLVLGGMAIERIAAITFTEKAAAELKDRVREGLEDGLRGHPERAGVIRPALESLDRAQISTIHSFCQHLLRLFAAEAGVDPSFEVQDEITAERRFQERWRGYVEGLSDDEHAAAVIDRVLSLGMTTGELETLAKGLTSRAELLSLLAQSLPPADGPDWSALLGQLATLRRLTPAGVPATDELKIRIEAMISLVVELMANDAERETILAASAGLLARTLRGCGDESEWGGAMASARAACEEVRDGLRDLLAACRSHALEELMPLIVRFVDGDGTARGRDGLMTFDDLILRVRDLLQADVGAARSLRERHDALLIDEFQDTDLSASISPWRSRRIRRRERSSPGGSSWWATRSSRSIGSGAPTWRSTRERARRSPKRAASFLCCSGTAGPAR
jgi:ATP-dependent exoDNAse (exonuclease V) beta subunit